MTPRTIPVDWQAFAAHVERLRYEHATRSPEEGVRRTLTAWANNGTQPPESFFRCNPGARAVWRELLDNREESPLWTC